MKRVVLALAAAALAGCGSGTPSTRSVVVYWDFLRHTQTAQGNVKYDVGTPPAGTADGMCAQSGVDYVTITEGNQVVNPELPQIPCVYAGEQGAQINRVRRGDHVWTITGYRNDGVPTFVATRSFNVSGNTRVDATLEGVPDDLDVNVGFYGPRGGLVAQTCAAAGVGFLAYNLFDGAGTVVASGDVPCPNPPGFTFRNANGTGVDRDVYTIRIQAFRDQTSQTPLFDDQTTLIANPPCQASSFDHRGTDVGPGGWGVPLYDVSNPAQALCR